MSLQRGERYRGKQKISHPPRILYGGNFAAMILEKMLIVHAEFSNREIGKFFLQSKKKSCIGSFDDSGVEVFTK
jgi:hypothetical protein